GTFRNQTQSDAFNNQYKDKAFALTLDITNPHEIKNTIQLVSDKFSRVDMLVNNAGFGLAGAIEEASIAEVREIFETNFFGTLQLTQAFLP
ncbi:SDR family NAD(P)-dependent oxidoreductase, partial [Acinetobacter baumannii]